MVPLYKQNTPKMRLQLRKCPTVGISHQIYIQSSKFVLQPTCKTIYGLWGVRVRVRVH